MSIGKDREHWAVTVRRNGDEVVTIESNCLSGRELLSGDEDMIRNCAEHLLSFIGTTTPTTPSTGK